MGSRIYPVSGYIHSCPSQHIQPLRGPSLSPQHLCTTRAGRSSFIEEPELPL